MKVSSYFADLRTGSGTLRKEAEVNMMVSWMILQKKIFSNSGLGPFGGNWRGPLSILPQDFPECWGKHRWRPGQDQGSSPSLATASRVV